MGVVNTNAPLNYPTEVSRAVYLAFCIINRCCGDSALLKKLAETCPCRDGTGLLCHVALFASSKKQEYDDDGGKGKTTGKKKV